MRQIAMVGACCVVFAGFTLPATRGQAIEALWNEYLGGDFAGALEESRGLGPDAFLKAARDSAPRWIAAGESPHRRLVVASVGLEVANDRLGADWSKAREIIEWACEIIVPGPPDEAKQTWFRASIALAERAQDWDLLRSSDGSGPLVVARTRVKVFDHLRHALEAFPQDARLQIAPMRIFANRQTPGWPRKEDDRVRLLPARMANRADAIRALAPFVADTDVGDEASLWIGLLQTIGLDQTELALLRFDAASGSEDDYIAYLGHLFAARILEQELHDPDTAMLRYRAALDRLPAQSAALALAVLESNHGGRPSVRALEALTEFQHASLDDPWVTYGFGDYRHWDAYVHDLRRAVTR